MLILTVIKLLDEIDKIVLSQLGKNARKSSLEIANILKDIGYDVTDRTIRKRLERLEKNNTVIGYSPILNPMLVSEKINRTMLLKFKYSTDSKTLLDRLISYVDEVPSCIFSAKITGGEFSWICHFVFDSLEQYELESNNFLNRFADLISDYRTFESQTIKASPYTIIDDRELNQQKVQVYRILNSIKKHDNLNDKLQEIVESLVKYFNAKFARIWLVDKERKNLILRFSAGKYKNIDGEFSKVSIDSLKIGPIVKTKKPAITNDVVNDPRIRYPEWAKRENLKSYAGYPLTYKGESIGVLAMFSEKKLNAVDFEVLGIFCDQLSKELSGFFGALEFLSV